MTSEARRVREERREELIERLNSEEQPPSREEIEESERRAEREDQSRSLKGVLLCLVACSSWPVVFGLAAGVEAYVWLPGPVGLWIGVLSVYAAFRYLGWGRSVAKAIWVASFIGWLGMLWALHFPVGAPVLGSELTDLPTLVHAAYGAVGWFLARVWIIAGVTDRRLSYEEHRS